MEPKLPQGLIKLKVKGFELGLAPQIIDSVHKVLEVHIGFVLSIPLPLLFLDLIWIIGRSLSTSQCLDHVHHLYIELHIFGLFIPHHNVIMQMKMQKSDHFLFCWLEKGMFNVAKHNIHSFIRP
ncbi:hypothetical protein PanWU01x14_087290 [Parasponia andersonii]|uniref:Uncharacterized protein n=1 Tax=Parasponia andersonii TaxID=3476 RepID=A0A2P5D8M7_PARAD|nr:hypothetical protein PanWU01x14_087290 [Parasponia andersonii]